MYHIRHFNKVYKYSENTSWVSLIIYIYSNNDYNHINEDRTDGLIEKRMVLLTRSTALLTGLHGFLNWEFY